jgi:hypothetical protein
MIGVPLGLNRSCGVPGGASSFEWTSSSSHDQGMPLGVELSFALGGSAEGVLPPSSVDLVAADG